MPADRAVTEAFCPGSLPGMVVAAGPFARRAAAWPVRVHAVLWMGRTQRNRSTFLPWRWRVSLRSSILPKCLRSRDPLARPRQRMIPRALSLLRAWS